MYPRYHNPNKKYVSVMAEHKIGGGIVPLSFTEEDSMRIEIDKIVDVRQAASLKAGGNGIRYTCLVEGREILLFHDRDDWFIEV